MIDTNEIRRLVRDHEVSASILALCDEVDRLRAKPKPQGKTVRVRIPVVVDEFKNWSAAGWNGAKDDEMKDGLFDAMEGVAVLHWLTADLPIPEETEIEAEVENGR